MNTQEIILDFLIWFVRHKEDIFDLVEHPKATVDEYIEMLQAVEDLNDDNQLKIEFKNE